MNDAKHPISATDPRLVERLVHMFDHGHAERREPHLNWQSYYPPDMQFRPAAVLIAVTRKPQPGVLMIQRPDTMRKHAGQVAYPGGKIDQGEDAVTAALREAWEELAINPEHVDIVGTTDPFLVGSGFEIVPVLGLVPDDIEIRPNPAEVASWFEIPLTTLLNPSRFEMVPSRNRIPVQEYPQQHFMGHRIWGATAAITVNLAHRLGVIDDSSWHG